MSCKAKANGEVMRKAKASYEFTYDGKPYYYCQGYIDRMTDELIDTCRECKNNVIYAQEDFDKLRMGVKI